MENTSEYGRGEAGVEEGVECLSRPIYGRARGVVEERWKARLSMDELEG